MSNSIQIRTRTREDLLYAMSSARRLDLLISSISQQRPCFRALMPTILRGIFFGDHCLFSNLTENLKAHT
jgi:hypothetical protein